ncbi:MAG TPA: ADP-glyceromanno-heptose 6-epimerase [Saprospiraceae bacterium]|nr:ADP-glyceromanno-heptose 6-epimerase [Saprospiraceae bacterium]HND88216.1 ADP-glyceromanno-heptose 6-epimerase [Saprospiraceae bacterium]HNG89098.1 ADP-glyceromanno-heptose 6-epimerase [Saprospiraceae bacterium]
MIVVTGAAGFIGSCMIRRLNEAGYTDVLAVDEFSRPDKMRNLEGKQTCGQVQRMNFLRWLERHHAEVEAVLHLGARTDTTEQDKTIFDELNLEYSKALWMLCAGFHIPLYYASSAATYGLGELGYSDDHALIPRLRPLNPYGQSKQDFDEWVLERLQPAPDGQGNAADAWAWAGFKFFNVYGPNEYHKGRMASVIMHTARKIKQTGGMQLFRSHRPDFADGHQSRDFIYVKDVVDVLLFFLENRPPNGIYNLGTGKARTFLDLATSTFGALHLEPNISFIDTPADIRDTYQYFTQADMGKLRAAGYHEPFYGLEEGIADYVQRYLTKGELIW